MSSRKMPIVGAYVHKGRPNRRKPITRAQIDRRQRNDHVTVWVDGVQTKQPNVMCKPTYTPGTGG